MPKRFSKEQRPRDVNQLAHHLVRLSTEETPKEIESHQSEISRIMSEMGTKGGKISGERRLVNLTPEQRSQIALKAAQARWNKKLPKKLTRKERNR